MHKKTSLKKSGRKSGYFSFLNFFISKHWVMLREVHETFKYKLCAPEPSSLVPIIVVGFIFVVYFDLYSYSTCTIVTHGLAESLPIVSFLKVVVDICSMITAMHHLMGLSVKSQICVLWDSNLEEKNLQEKVRWGLDFFDVVWIFSNLDIFSCIQLYSKFCLLLCV